MKPKVTLKSLQTKVQVLMKEIRDMRDTMFIWGQQNMKDLDNMKLLVKKYEELKEVKE